MDAFARRRVILLAEQIEQLREREHAGTRRHCASQRRATVHLVRRVVCLADAAAPGAETLPALLLRNLDLHRRGGPVAAGLAGRRVGGVPLQTCFDVEQVGVDPLLRAAVSPGASRASVKRLLAVRNFASPSRTLADSSSAVPCSMSARPSARRSIASCRGSSPAAAVEPKASRSATKPRARMGRTLAGCRHARNDSPTQRYTACLDRRHHAHHCPHHPRMSRTALRRLR